MVRGAASDEVMGRFLAVDDQGSGLRATWRPAHGFVNLSLWRGDRCVETFHLSPSDAAGLVGFLATSLASAVPPPVAAPALRIVGPEPQPTPGGPSRWQAVRSRLLGVRSGR